MKEIMDRYYLSGAFDKALASTLCAANMKASASPDQLDRN